MTGGQLARVVGVPGAVLMGLGSILGTGIFVSIGIATGVAGPAVVIAVAIAALVAVCNGLSSAQLAASHPVSGGTYEYGYRFLGPTLGFTAGWMFLCAKSASAATAALGFAGYALAAADVTDRYARIGGGVALVLVITAIVAGGMSRSNRTNTVIVIATLVGLAAFVIAGIPTAVAGAGTHLELGGTRAHDLLHATALMFVAYTGYGRIATLGEEVHAPTRTIPRAIIIALLATMALYAAVVVVAVSSVGAPVLAAATATSAPLEVVAATFRFSEVRYVIAVAAITAMAGVLLNLVLGLSRVVLAMGRRGDLPPAVAHVERGSPRRAVIVTGVGIAGLVLLGSVKTTWSFSAFTVLVYYAITNLAALRLPAEQRRYPRVVSVAGLASCLGLAFFIEPSIWLAGLGVIGAGLSWHLVIAKRWRAR
ncbi:MAG: APC family permease [Myxococcota bacterium]|nr:APC family permease [Myxococcota bacterium]